ncbi:asparagine synthase (glutamine-hydrolyzing) [Aquirufa rosea]|uniref:asparagine synthase (glutamine-hydrolyzing) n=1 Tax=Aquirufa rosea TaxID=2509241 RepID=A0A4Q1BZ29_9BACT|nr:asparagine synthase (glutamine-hydrolyzing) [Aquirufa rosea]RXK48275.1 asparagine synthase (glutamine-hydrolyzing) [Aquirufa rosea]
MCGIVGFYERSFEENSFEKMNLALNKMRHRGPDDSGIEKFKIDDGILMLGQTRLSIIDLTSGGHQPMSSIDGRYSIIFNGEIYNYRELRDDLKILGYGFRTDSDTEVLLIAWIHWGKSSLRKLIGMFAFCIFDNYDNTLTLVRDAFGIKPFFYNIENGNIRFASELPAILELFQNKPKINIQRSLDYLIYGSYDNNINTFYENILHLLPGHFLKINLDNYENIKQEKWWQPSIKENSDISFNEAASQLRELFLKNIQLHLRSDVPIGAALSGGLDSSAVVCAMRYLYPNMPIHTFSYVAKGSTVDEEKWADIINNHVNAIPHKINVSYDELVKDIDKMINIQGEPFGGTSIYAQYRVYKEARKQGVVVTLDGQGADELLAGYSGYPEGYILSLKERGHYLRGLNFLYNWAKWPGRHLGHSARIFITVMLPISVSKYIRVLLNTNIDNPIWLNKQYLLKNKLKAEPSIFNNSSVDGRKRRLVEQLRSALLGCGLSQLLRHGDRNSMMWSVESRVPFLTIEMAEFLLSLPEHYLLSPQGETKYVFRKAMRGIVPDEILDRKDKIGFQTPENAWLKQLKKEINEWVDINPKDVPFLNLEKIIIELNEIIDGKKKFSSQAWRLINYCRWIQNQSNI